jgi:hypothetical protein
VRARLRNQYSLRLSLGTLWTEFYNESSGTAIFGDFDSHQLKKTRVTLHSWRNNACPFLVMTYCVISCGDAEESVYRFWLLSLREWSDLYASITCWNECLMTCILQFELSYMLWLVWRSIHPLLTTYILLVPKPRMVELYLHFPIRLNSPQRQIYILPYITPNLNHWSWSCS